MLMLAARRTIATWILQDNLSRFLDRVSALIRFRFQEWDWDAIRFGVRDSDAEQNRWYEYELNGQPSVNLAFAHAGNGKRLCVRIETDAIIAARLDAFARIMQCHQANNGTQDLQILVQAAFIDLSEPDQSKIVSCDEVHLAVCSECQDTLAFFTGKHWIDLLREGAWASYGDASYWMLAAEARSFFFPAYLVIAIRDNNRYLLEEVLRRVEKELWTPLQQELIQYAVSLLKRDELMAR